MTEDEFHIIKNAVDRLGSRIWWRFFWVNFALFASLLNAGVQCWSINDLHQQNINQWREISQLRQQIDECSGWKAAPAVKK